MLHKTTCSYESLWVWPSPTVHFVQDEGTICPRKGVPPVKPINVVGHCGRLAQIPLRRHVFLVILCVTLILLIISKVDTATLGIDVLSSTTSIYSG